MYGKRPVGICELAHQELLTDAAGRRRVELAVEPVDGAEHGEIVTRIGQFAVEQLGHIVARSVIRSSAIQRTA